MTVVLVLWPASAAATLGLFLLFSLAIDRKVSFSSWVRLGLSCMALLGPLGTALTAVFLFRVAGHVLRVRSWPPGRKRRVSERDDIRWDHPLPGC